MVEAVAPRGRGPFARAGAAVLELEHGDVGHQTAQVSPRPESALPLRLGKIRADGHVRALTVSIACNHLRVWLCSSSRTCHRMWSVLGSSSIGTPLLYCKSGRIN